MVALVVRLARAVVPRVATAEGLVATPAAAAHPVAAVVVVGGAVCAPVAVSTLRSPLAVAVVVVPLKARPRTALPAALATSLVGPRPSGHTTAHLVSRTQVMAAAEAVVEAVAGEVLDRCRVWPPARLAV